VNQTIQLLFDQASQAHRGNRPAEAEKQYRQVLAQAPGHFPAHYMLAVLLYQRQRAAEALIAVEAALRLHPAEAAALMLHGVLLQEGGRMDEAIGQLDKAVAAQPAYAEAWYNRGVTLAKAGRHQDAVASFDKVLALKPSADAWNNRAAALLNLGALDAALQSTNRALALNPGMASAWHNLGSIHSARNRSEEALAAFDKALALQPGGLESWNSRGFELYRLGRHADCLENYDRMVALHPHHAQGWSNRGVALRRLRQYDAAVASFDKAIALAPDYIDAHINRAAVLRVQQRHDEALAAMDALLARAPDNARALIERATALCETGRIAEGFAAFSRHAERTKGGAANLSSAHKQRHDAEQRAHLAKSGVGRDAFHLTGGARVARAVNPNAEAQTSWGTARPQMVVIDNLLTPDALEGLRQFCWGSTVWNDVHPEGYLGALPKHGFACPLLAQIAEEFRETFPSIFETHELRQLWGFKYDSRLSGIPLHADQAAVNVNFWITPDAANLDPLGGGLIVWDIAAPQDWDFDRYNSNAEENRAFLRRAGAKPVTIAYRANRAVIFHSDLFHETAPIRFQQGYLNRRINVTMLYGRRRADGG
jgi:tetratricopeptide (TPR) repeat protein